MTGMVGGDWQHIAAFGLSPHGKPAVQAALARHRQRTLLAFTELDGLWNGDAEWASAWREALARLRSALERDPRNAAPILSLPSLATPLQCAVLRDSLPEFAASIDASLRQAVASVLFELSARGVLAPGDAVVSPVPERPLASALLRVEVSPPPGTTHLRYARSRLDALDGAGATIGTLHVSADADLSGFEARTSYWPVGQVSRLSRVDHNPIAAFEAHPDKRGNAVDLGGRSEAEWRTSLEDALALVDQYLPEVRDEMRVLLHEVVPVGYDEQRHLSASYREAIGTVYLTLHPNTMTMTEALVHEFQHNKLNLAQYDHDFLENAYTPLYKSPVRPDPRPLWGILLAVHAFLPVAVLYRRMRDTAHPWSTRPDWLRRLGEIDLKNHEGMEMLRANAVWRPAGRALFESLDRLDRAHMAERAAAGLPVSPESAHVG